MLAAAIAAGKGAGRCGMVAYPSPWAMYENHWMSLHGEAGMGAGSLDFHLPSHKGPSHRGPSPSLPQYIFLRSLFLSFSVR